LTHQQKDRSELFWKYQQRVQFGFIKEYVPVLPYSSLSLGIALAALNQNIFKPEEVK
jgi:hypothetical protein